MHRKDEKTMARINHHIEEGLIALENALDHFREAYRAGSGMGELLFRRTNFSLFIHDLEANKNGNNNDYDLLQKRPR